jgi:hypothetical protein
VGLASGLVVKRRYGRKAVNGLEGLVSLAVFEVDASSYGIIVSLVMILLPESMALEWLSFILLFIYAVMIIISVSRPGGLREAIGLFSHYESRFFSFSLQIIRGLRNVWLWGVFLFAMLSAFSLLLLKVGKGGISIILLSGGLLALVLLLVIYHLGILTFLLGLKDALEDPVFQLASTLIAVPWCTSLVPGFIELVVWVVSQFFSSVSHVSLFAVWSQVAAFFVANLASWILVESEARSLLKELGKGGESPGGIVESCGARGVV